jgi:hypothetical protein
LSSIDSHLFINIATSNVVLNFEGALWSILWPSGDWTAVPFLTRSFLFFNIHIRRGTAGAKPQSNSDCTYNSVQIRKGTVLQSSLTCHLSSVECWDGSGKSKCLCSLKIENKREVWIEDRVQYMVPVEAPRLTNIVKILGRKSCWNYCSSPPAVLFLSRLNLEIVRGACS